MINKRVEIEFNIQSGNVFTLNDPVKGVLNSTTYTLGGVQYVDVSDYVKSFSTNRGRSRELDRYQSGSASVVFDNRLRTFDPVYADGPYAGNIIPRKKVRIWGEYITVPASTVTNYIPNPSFETDLTGWTGSGTTRTRTLGTFYVGTASMQAIASALNDTVTTSTIAVTGSQTFTASVWVRGEVGKYLRLTLREKNGGGSSIGSSSTADVLMNDGWMRLDISRPFSASGVGLEIEITNRTSGAHTFYVDAAMVTATDSLLTYFDGSTTPDDEYTTYAWSGTANNSASTRTVVEHLAGDVIYGLIDDWDLAYDVNGESIASITVIDELGLFNRRIPVQGMKPVMKTGQRINEVLTEVGWPLDRRRIETGKVTLQKHQIVDDTDSLTYMQMVESAEQGDLFIAKDGDVVFRGRNDVPGASGTVVIADDGAGIPYTAIQIVYGTELLYNTAYITTYYYDESNNLVETTAVAYGGTIPTYGQSNISFEQLPIDTDTALDLAIYLVNRYQNPEYRFESVEINLLGLTDVQRRQVLDLELTDVVQVKFTPNNIGDPIEKYAQIISIQNSATVDRSTVRLGFRTLEFSGWLLGTEQFGRLDFITMN